MIDTNMLKYNLKDFSNISFQGFNLVVPPETIQIIQMLSVEVGSSSYIKTPLFNKKDISKNEISKNELMNSAIKKRRCNKNIEVLSDDWENIRTFQVTKVEQKTGIDGRIDQVRLLLNKLTDKTYLDIREKIFNIIEELINNNTIDEEMEKIGTSIFELASTNKFYSKIYADLYGELIKKYSFLRPVFDTNYNSYIDVFKNIECGDPSKDYDHFCSINKTNEKRKAISMFFVNLAINNVVSKLSIINILVDLLTKIMIFIQENDKKNEVDEFTENIAILYNKKIIDSELDISLFKINGQTIHEAITLLSNSKSKDYKSLSNKAIFKYMDLVDILI